MTAVAYLVIDAGVVDAGVVNAGVVDAGVVDTGVGGWSGCLAMFVDSLKFEVRSFGVRVCQFKAARP